MKMDHNIQSFDLNQRLKRQASHGMAITQATTLEHIENL